VIAVSTRVASGSEYDIGPRLPRRWLLRRFGRARRLADVRQLARARPSPPEFRSRTAGSRVPGTSRVRRCGAP
jgi:hypothetical protein